MTKKRAKETRVAKPRIIGNGDDPTQTGKIADLPDKQPVENGKAGCNAETSSEAAGGSEIKPGNNGEPARGIVPVSVAKQSEDFSGFPTFPVKQFNLDNQPSREPAIILTPPRRIVLPSETFRLSSSEKDILARLKDKERVVRARIRTIALPNYAGVRGLFLYGPPGHGKSFLLRTELDKVCGHGKWLLYNSDMSPPALLAEMEEHCEMPFALEDCEQLLGNVKNRGILRSAMAPPFRVNPKNMKTPYDFVFEAPIYILSNLPLDERHGVLEAIASRTGPIHWHLTRPELAARMKRIALRDGGDDLTVAERWEVAQYCIEQLNARGRVDLRTLCDVGFPARVQHKRGALNIDWKDYIDSYVRGKVEMNPERRHERISREQQIACEVYLAGIDTDDRHRLWEERTRLKKTAFRDRLAEARASGLFDPYVAQQKAGKSEMDLPEE